jgi:hypothetical protein
LLHKVKTEGSVGKDGKLRGLALNGSKIAAKVCPPDGNIHFLTIIPMRGVYLPFNL